MHFLPLLRRGGGRVCISFIGKNTSFANRKKHMDLIWAPTSVTSQTLSSLNLNAPLPALYLHFFFIFPLVKGAERTCYDLVTCPGASYRISFSGFLFIFIFLSPNNNNRIGTLVSLKELRISPPWKIPRWHIPPSPESSPSRNIPPRKITHPHGIFPP